jgi:predicted alpha/beta hydrolase family esterase
MCVVVLAAIGLGVAAVHWYFEQWATQGQREVSAVARADAEAAVRQAELGAFPRRVSRQPALAFSSRMDAYCR